MPANSLFPELFGDGIAADFRKHGVHLLDATDAVIEFRPDSFCCQFDEFFFIVLRIVDLHAFVDQDLLDRGFIFTKERSGGGCRLFAGFKNDFLIGSGEFLEQLLGDDQRLDGEDVTDIRHIFLVLRRISSR